MARGKRFPLDDITLEDTPPNPEAAQDALAMAPEPEVSSSDTDKARRLSGNADAAAPIPEMASRPRRKTKNELEAENARLAADLKAAQEKATAASPDMLMASRNAMKATLAGAFGMAAMVREEEHWRLSEPEANLLADAWAPCVAMALGRHPEIVVWAGAVGVTYTVIAPRVMVSRAKEKAARIAATAPPPSTMEATP